MTTNEYIHKEREEGWPTFESKLWQRNYYERVIRDNESLNEIREYILNNPGNWNNDDMFLEMSEAIVARNRIS